MIETRPPGPECGGFFGPKSRGIGTLGSAVQSMLPPLRGLWQFVILVTLAICIEWVTITLVGATDASASGNAFQADGNVWIGTAHTYDDQVCSLPIHSGKVMNLSPWPGTNK